MRYSVLLITLGVFLASCSVLENDEPLDFFYIPAGLDLAGLDSETRPQDDFYHYVNGNWIENTDIPDSQSITGVLINLRSARDIRVYDILTGFIKQENKKKGTNEQILGDLFYSLLQEQFVADQGIEPIRFLLDAIDEIKTKDQLEHTIAKLSFSNIKIPIGFDVRPDLNDTSKYILTLFQGDLGLPDRTYYLNPDQEFEKIRDEYKTYLEKILAQANFDEAAKRAQNAYKLEHLIAKAQTAKVDRRDLLKITNHYQPDALSGLTDKLNWKVYLQTLEAEAETYVNINETGFFVALGNILEEQSLDAWKDYLRIRILDAFALYLEDELRVLYNDFHAGVIGGVDTNPTRLQEAIAVINDVMGGAIGRVYITRYFSPESKRRIDNIVVNVKDALKERLKINPWISNSTKARAIYKLDNIVTEIGHPDVWTDYSDLVVNQQTPVQNIVNIYDFYFKQRIKKLGTPVKRNAWKLTPSAVNAQYLLYQNAMFYPAGFLEPPYFNPGADEAVNYAGIGVIIGHEIAHAFDDQGRQFGPEGNLENWWTENDLENFNSKTRVLINLFQQFSPIEGMTIDGRLTLGENIGDLVGVQIAYDAYIKSLGGSEAPIINGLTGSQRFFIGYAQSVRSKIRPEALRLLLVSDPHSPDKYRVLGILPHIPAFYDAFQVKAGDGMYLPPEERVTIW